MGFYLWFKMEKNGQCSVYKGQSAMMQSQGNGMEIRLLLLENVCRCRSKRLKKNVKKRRKKEEAFMCIRNIVTYKSRCYKTWSGLFSAEREKGWTKMFLR